MNAAPPLDWPPVAEEIPDAAELAAAFEAPAATVSGFILPNDHQPIIESAKAIFGAIAPTHTLFIRGRTIVKRVDSAEGSTLEMVTPTEFRSLLENYGQRLFCYIKAEDGLLVLRPKAASEDCAKALLASAPAFDLLPKIRIMTAAPVIILAGEQVKILAKGYHSESGGILVTGGKVETEIPAPEARAALLDLISEFSYQTPGDKARALAAYFTPALKIGGFIGGPIPLSIAEANESQAGKTFGQKLVRAVYSQSAYSIARRNGGVGSLDESLSAALLSAQPFVAIDNVREKVDSQFLEQVLTWGGAVNARVPHRGEISVDATAVTFQLTSNGAECSRDLANRSSVERIIKRRGHKFRDYPEGDLLAHAKARQSYYLGCVYSIIKEWHRQGMPANDERRHDFREWAGKLDWIVQNLLGTAPLLDGHEAAQERISNPALSWLRRVALAVADSQRLGEEFSATCIYELCTDSGIDIPGLRIPNEDHGRRVIGSLMLRCFGGNDELTLDHLRASRQERQEFDATAQRYRTVKRYTFSSL